MTERLYYTDAYRTSFSASVVDRADDGRRIYLDESAFYPTSGGQQHDTGTLGGIDVVDVVDEDDRVAHVLAAPLATDVSRVEGSVDWTRRFDNMQQHTGQHLLSAVFEDLYGFKTVSVHFGDEYSTLDIDAESVTRDQLVSVEARANFVVGEARPVTVSFEDAASASGLRKASDREGTLRIVSIADLDRSACGGTHVRTTAEIGAVLLRSVEKVRRATRVEFVCGARAINRARRDYEALSRLGQSLSCSVDDAADVVATQLERAKETDNARKKLEKELASYRIGDLYDKSSASATGVRVIVVRDASSIDELKALAQAAFALPRVMVIGALTNPPSVLVATSEDSGLQAGNLLKERLASVGGRGGGSPRLAQGSVPNVAGVESVVAGLVTAAG